MKNVLLLEHYYSPDELRERFTEWVDYYNHQRYHGSLDNVRPADAYWGCQEQIIAERQKNQAANDSPTAGKSYFSENTKRLKPALLFSPLRRPGRICPLSVDDIHTWLYKPL